MTDLNPPLLFDASKHTHLIPSLISLHQTCILSPPHTIATFLPPLSTPLMTTWWESRIAETTTSPKQRQIIVQLANNEETGGEEVAGVVMLGMPFAETGPWRASVEKLLVGPGYRRKGIARRLMELVEVVARKEGRGLLLLDTEKGSPAEFIYPKLGYFKVGEVPRYEISPKDGSWKDGVFFYKDLR